MLEVHRCGAESAIARIVHLVERAQARKAPIQGLADRVAGRFTLGVLALAVATLLFWWLWGSQHWPAVLAAAGQRAPTAMGGASGPATPFSLALQLAIAVLVVACPCALGLATPTAITVGSGLAARSGLLFRGGDAIETASRIGAVLFDKTGTLTVGRPLVTAIRVAGEAPGSPAAAALGDRLVQLAASLEQHSRHPLAHALLQEAQGRGVTPLPVDGARAHPGNGVQGLLEGGVPVRVGQLSWLRQSGVAVDPAIETHQPGAGERRRHRAGGGPGWPAAGPPGGGGPAPQRCRRHPEPSCGSGGCGWACSAAIAGPAFSCWGAGWACGPRNWPGNCGRSRSWSASCWPIARGPWRWWATASTTPRPWPPPIWASPSARAPRSPRTAPPWW